MWFSISHHFNKLFEYHVIHTENMSIMIIKLLIILLNTCIKDITRIEQFPEVLKNVKVLVF